MRPSIFFKKYQGFTLVELSVVLVIVALLVGGIVGLRSYVVNARLNTLMNESKIYINAFSQFQARYNAIPGDYATASAAWAGAGNGDGNGLIRAGSTPQPLERYYAFQHLARAGFIPGTYTGAVNSNGGASIGVNVAGASMDKVAFLFDHPDALDGFVSGDSLYFDGTYGNLLRIAGLTDGYSGIPDKAFLSAKQAYQIDDKFDDGQPGLGNITTPIASVLANCANGSTTSAAYDTGASTDSPRCYLFLKMP